MGRTSMIEAIRTFFGRIVGLHENKKTVVVEGLIWKCTKCNFIFLTKEEGEKHGSENRC
jgi:hypothetical protein